VRAFLQYISFRIVALSGLLPARAGYALATWVGRLIYRLMPNLRRDLADNFRHVLGPDASEAEVLAVVRKQCVYVVKNLYDLFRLGRLTIEEVSRVTRVEGGQLLFDELDAGHGVIAITAHFGSTEVVGQMPSVFGVPLTGMALRTKNDRQFRFVLGLRRSHGLNLVPTDQSPIVLFRALQRGEIVALPCDQDYNGQGRLVRFFGAETRLPDGALRIAYRTGAPVLPVFAQRLPDDTFVLEFEPPLPLPHNGDRAADLEAAMERVVSLLERRIRAHPEQWLVTGRVWPEE
jgi:lauroyl/myristoyl acyltransferase